MQTLKSQLQQLKDNTLQRKAQKDIIENDIEALKKDIDSLFKEYENALSARKIIQEAGKRTQEKLEVHISSLVTAAIQAVFGDKIEFVVNFVEKRGKTECELSFRENGELLDPMFASGGGLLDIASFALRVSFLCLDNSKRKTVLLDEPLKYLSKDLVPLGFQFIKSVSEDLGIQFIIVSHIEECLDIGDNIVYIKDGRVVDND